jgi:radical SAM superfamily enzyme YgiQ (UPF0313 family)
LVHPLGGVGSGDVTRLANIMPPIGLAGLAAWLERAGHHTTIVDGYADPKAIGRIRRVVNDEHPHLLGLSCTTASFLDGAGLAALAKTWRPGIRTVVGGPHVSALKEKSLEGFPAFDFGVVGEGEETLAELVESRGESPAAVRGLVYRDDDGVPRYTGPRERHLDLDALPFPAYEKLARFPAAYKLPIVTAQVAAPKRAAT